MKRLFSAIAAAAVLSFFSAPAVFAADPANGEVSPSSPKVEYNSGPFLIANPTPVLLLDNGPECGDFILPSAAQPCDDFTLTVNLPTGYVAAHPDAKVKVSLSWMDAGAGASDYDLYIFKGLPPTRDGLETADFKGPGQGNPEVTAIVPLSDGVQTYTITIVPFTPTGEMTNVKIELDPGATGGGGGGGGGGPGVIFGQATPTAPGVPRYQNFFPQNGSGANSSSGEFNIGFNPKTGNIMVNSSGPVFRVTVPEKQTPPLPEAGPALWTNVSPSIASITTLDPILFTDQATGRTFVSNQTTGAEALFAFTDDDGATWIQASAAPPNGGADHQTIGAGPYPAPFTGGTPVYPNAVYYCSQALVPDFCQRSDSGGLEFAPGVPANTGLTDCGGLHGHVRVAPNGTVYLPNKGCGSAQGVSVSSTAGAVWSDSLIPNSLPGETDPSVGIDQDNAAYFCYINGDGHPHVAVSRNNGATWSDDFDIGAAVGIKNAVFAQAIAGSPGRAACGFVGTDTAGNSQATDFPGIWYLFIATTYDGGKTWTTVNATPNDPVQGKGGICTGGISCGSNRNLLDFNEVTLDDKGRVLFGYDDGCVTGNCIGSGGETNDFAANQKIARQTGGKTLLASEDVNTDTAAAKKPKAPFLSATRSGTAVNLTWNAPDNGGSDIASYDILRGASSGSETKIASVSGAKTQFQDTTAPADPVFYKLVAVNGQGPSPDSNEATPSGETAQAESACVLPGIKVFTDPTGDNTGKVPGQDLRAGFIAEPFTLIKAGKDRFGFALDVDSLNPVQTPNTVYFLNYTLSDKVQHWVSFDTSAPPGTDAFTYGHIEASTGVNRSVKDGDADPESALDLSKNRIVWVLSKEKVPAFATTPTLTGVFGEVRALIGAAGAGLIATVDSSSTGTYNQIGNASCAPNTAPLAALTAVPTSGQAPLTVNFNGSGSTDPDAGDTIASYTFDFGDGIVIGPQAGATASHTYSTANNFKATLTVTDSRGKASVNDASVVIQVAAPPPSNSPPTARLTTSPSSGAAPLAVTLDAAGSTDPDGAADITGYSFNFGDGSALVTGASATANHTYNTAGAFTARVTVTDSAGHTSSASASVTVTSGGGGTPPPPSTTLAAHLVADPLSGTKPLAVDFDASGSSGPVTGYTFNFGDGSPEASGASSTATHTYTSVGSFSASVVVSDGQGSSASQAVVITVNASGTSNPVLPVASLAVSPANGVVPVTVHFDGTGSHDPAGDAIVSYTFDFGDNSPAVTQAGPTVSHPYDAAGTYRASLTVSDSQGQTSEPVFVTITLTTSIVVTPPGGPVAALKLGNNKGPAPLNVSFDGAKSFDPAGGTIQSYTFDFGDGSAVVTRTVSQFGVNAPLTSHVYLVPGTYTPSLTVTNQDGVVSPNPAKATVEATGPGSKGGGALGLLTLLPLLGIGLARRRRH